MTTVSGRVAVVTHGAGPLGRGVCTALGRERAQLVIGDPEPGAAARVAAELAADGVAAQGWETNPKRTGDIAALVERAVAAHGRVDIMVNVGVVPDSGPAELLSVEAFADGISTNLSGAFFGCQYAARQMLRQPRAAASASRGVIVNVTSVAAVVALPGHAAFCSAMAATNAMTKSLAVEWGPQGIRVAAIGAGLSADLLAGIIPIEGAARRVPPDAPAAASEVGRAVARLASDDARAIAGTTVYVDGGWLADGYWE